MIGLKYKFLEKKNDTNEHPRSFLKFVNKVLLAILLGLVSLIVMEYSPKFKYFMQNEVLDKNFSFAFLGNLYEKYLGDIVPSDNDSSLPVFNEKLVYSQKEQFNNGYKLSVSDNYLVPTLTSGIVVFVGEKDEMGNVIVIEGDDSSTITYGNIHNTNIKLYDYINKGSFLGEVEDNLLYIIIQKNGAYEDIETYLS